VTFFALKSPALRFLSSFSPLPSHFVWYVPLCRLNADFSSLVLCSGGHDFSARVFFFICGLFYVFCYPQEYWQFPPPPRPCLFITIFCNFSPMSSFLYVFSLGDQPGCYRIFLPCPLGYPSLFFLFAGFHPSVQEPQGSAFPSDVL